MLRLGAMARNIDAVLFDFGGVFTASPFGAMDAVDSHYGAEPGQTRGVVFGPYDRDTDHPWHRLERGEISLSDARAAIIESALALGWEGFDPIRVLVEQGAGDRGARGSVVERTRSLRSEGYRTALVTNNVREFSRGWRSLIPVDELFDLVVDSSEVGIRKPNPAIFEITLERLGGVAPERCIFLDDYEGNLVAARALGISTVLVGDDPEPALGELERLLASD
jgi:putative hydrolase of the HAD superfamily